MPVVVHHPGIERGRRLEFGFPRPLRSPALREVGGACAVFHQRSVEAAPCHAAVVVGDIHPSLHGHPVPVGLWPLVFFHLHDTPGDVDHCAGIGDVESESEVYAVLFKQRELVDSVGDFHPWHARCEAHTACDASASFHGRSDGEFVDKWSLFGEIYGEDRIGYGGIDIGREPGAGVGTPVYGCVDVVVGISFAGERDDVTVFRVYADSHQTVGECIAVGNRRSGGSSGLTYHHTVVARAERGDVVGQENQFAGGKTLGGNGRAVVAHNHVALAAFLGIKRDKASMRPRLGVVDGDAAVRRAFARTEGAV